MKFIILVVCLTIGFTANAQRVISGIIGSAQDSLPIPDASIYFNNTTIGTISKDNGAFKISNTTGVATDLVINVMGFETVRIPPSRQNNKQHIYLKPSIDALDEVFLNDDTWSREHKMAVFKRHFLGSIHDFKDLKILNESSINLRYSATNNILYADSNGSIHIRNRRLGYLLHYNLIDFEVIYEKNLGGFNISTKSFYAGTVFFENLKKNVRTGKIENRRTAYQGSLLHFLRALRDRNLTEENYQVFKGSFIADPYEIFSVENHKQGHLITTTSENIQILFNGIEQSPIIVEAPFYVDLFGNHNPVNAILVGGAMANRKVGDMLPLSYNLTTEN